jgi:hypothetical protein
MYSGIPVQQPLFLSDLIEIEFYLRIVEKYPNTKFRENPSGGK